MRSEKPNERRIRVEAKLTGVRVEAVVRFDDDVAAAGGRLANGASERVGRRILSHHEADDVQRRVESPVLPLHMITEPELYMINWLESTRSDVGSIPECAPFAGRRSRTRANSAGRRSRAR